jgi:hypothetical protein
MVVSADNLWCITTVSAQAIYTAREEIMPADGWREYITLEDARIKIDLASIKQVKGVFPTFDLKPHSGERPKTEKSMDDGQVRKKTEY